jgi:tetratricopeptide (TPR) repeat protein
MSPTRRRLVLGGATATVVALAGCSGDGDDTETDDGGGDENGNESTGSNGNGGDDATENESEGPSGNESDDATENESEGSNGNESDEETDGENGEQQATEGRLDDIEQRLLDAFEDIEEVDSGSSGVEEFDVTAVDTELSAVETDIDAVRDKVGPDSRQRFDAIEEFAAFGDSYRDVLAALNDVFGPFNRADTFIGNEQWERARDPLRQSRDAVPAAQDALANSQTTFEALSVDRLREATQTELEDVEEGLSTLRSLLDALDGILEALVLISEGIVPYEDGLDAFEQDRYGDAIGPLETAETKFEEATTVLETGADANEGTEYQREFETLACQWSALTDATGHFLDAARAFEEGDDERARAAVDDADAALQESENCESGGELLSLAPDAAMPAPGVRLPDRLLV